MITPKQVSESIGVPPATVRRWAVRFEPYLSPRRGKKRMYTVEDLNTFRKVKELSAEGFSAVKIAERLAVIEPDTSRGSELMVLDDFMRVLESAQNTIQELNNKLDAQDRRLTALEDWIKTPFWKRWGKRPPTE